MQEISSDSPENEKPGGFDLIGDMVKRLPNSPGVYRMIGENDDILYVGKARSLKKRVSSYARPVGHSGRIMRMILATRSMVFVTTATEAEALLLEANLIKRLRPRYNVLLRDDKSFPYIHIAEDHLAPRIVKHRGARKGKGAYFGPFASAGAVNRTINALQKAFLIRSCSDGEFENRSRPCLLHQIKRCAAPCTGKIDEKDYARLVAEVKNFLSGRSANVREELAAAMEAASEDLDFETAATYRDRLSAISHIQSHQGINPHSVSDADVFAIHQAGGQSCIQVFFFRAGQNWGNHAFFPRADKSLEADVVLASFLAQFYDDKPVPKQILVSHRPADAGLLGEALSERSGHKVVILHPQRGEKRQLVKHAAKNAEEALARKLSNTASQTALVEGLATVFGLACPPVRIEVYDNSHIMGTNPVGAMIVAGLDGFLKSQYRKFNFKSEELVPGDDYGMMREVMQRRFTRLLKEHGPPPLISEPDKGDDLEGQVELEKDTSVSPWPDLLLIDGGKGQFSSVCSTLEELGLGGLPVVGIAKGPERDAGREKFIVRGREPFMLKERDPVLYFVQRLRDEAHRFAVGSHKARRAREFVKNPLDEIAGVGPTRKRALLKIFGSAKAISRAGIDDLMAVPGISAEMAKIIYDHFQS